MKRVGLYPGTFDPPTKGHLDIIGRAGTVVDHLILAVAENPAKSPLFSLEERVEMVREELESLADCPFTFEVQGFAGLLVEYAQKSGANVIIRGLRAVSDFDYEFQIASMNARLAPEIETVFLMASDRFHFIAANLVKEIARLQGDVSSFVSAAVAQRLAHAYRK
jgi:pantetheine-phosphate adenylyltransferase